MNNTAKLLRTSALVLSLSAISITAYAAQGGKTVIDSMLKQAIEETAAPEMVAPAPEPEPVIAPEPAPAPEIAAVEPVPVAEPEAAPKPVLGFMVGKMHFIPSLSLIQGYDNNIQAADSFDNEDYFTTVKPGIEGRLTDSPHELGVKAFYELVTFWEESDENEENYSVAAEGKVQTASHVGIPFKLHYSRDHESRSEDLARDLPDEKIEQRTYGGETGFQFKPGRLALTMLGRYAKEEFDDDATPGGTAVTRSDADREIWEGEGAIGFEIARGHTLSLGGLYGQRDYDNAQSGGTFNGIHRDSDHYAGYLGWSTDLGEKLQGHLKVGYESWDYDDSALPDVEGLYGEAGLRLAFADAAHVDLDLNHGYYEDDQIVQPIQRTLYQAMFGYDITPELTVGAGGRYDVRDFEGINRDDDTWALRVLAEYMLNENISLGAEYDRESRDSSVANFGYNKDVFLVRLTGQI